MRNFKFFGLNLGKLPNYVRYFGSNNVECVAESWMEVEMSWVEVDVTGWRWVHCLVIPTILLRKRKKEWSGCHCPFKVFDSHLELKKYSVNLGYVK